MNSSTNFKIDQLLFFGSFDPPHINHANIINFALDNINPKIFKIVVLNKHTDGKKLSSNKHRVEMLKLFSRHFDKRVSICTNDIKYSLSGKTIESLRLYKNNFPNQKLGILLGSDQYNGFCDWHEANEITKIATCFFIERPGYEIIKHIDLDNIVFLKNNISNNPDTSSLKIKYLLDLGEYEKVEAMTTPAVYSYLVKHNLYKSFFKANPHLRSVYGSI